MLAKIASLVLITTVLLVGEASAAGRRYAAGRTDSSPPPVVKTGEAQNAPVWVQPGGGPYRYNPYYQYRAMYPKYYWGLHARTYQNIGIPNGDIGIRGNSITPTPW